MNELLHKTATHTCYTWHSHGTNWSLSKRHGTVNFQARLRVPDDLVPVIGRKELTKSLGTPDYREAKKLARIVVSEWEARFQDLRARRDMTDADLEAAAAEQWRQTLEGDLDSRSRLPSEADREAAKQELMDKFDRGEVANDPLAILDAALDYPGLIDKPWNDHERRRRLLRDLQEQTATGETAIISAEVDAYIDRHKLTVQRDSQEFRDLTHRIARAEIDALKRTLERDRGDFTGAPNDPLLADVNLATRDSTTFDTIINRQLERVAKGIGGKRKSPHTVIKYRQVMQHFADWRGSARASTVTVHEVEQWRDSLFKIVAQKTVRDKVATVKTVLTWGNRQSKGKLFPKGFPLEFLELPAIPDSNSEDKAYTIEQAQKILIASRKQSKNYLRWIPWLLAYTGARINEITPLERRDVFQIGDDWFIHIRVEGERTTKTMKPRKVPLHPDIVKEGFIDFVETIKDGKLFPDVRVDQNMRDWIRESVMTNRKENSPAPNHGFRHLWEDLRRARLDHSAALYIAGRASKGSDDLYGKSNAMLPALAGEMRKFPSIL